MANKIKMVDNSDEIKRNIKQVTERAMLSACLIVEASAKSNSKVGSGDLRDTITHNIKQHSDQLIGQVGSPLMYAPYVEFGTGEFAENGNGRKGGWVYKTPDGEFHFTMGMKPDPFLRPAFRDNKENIKNIFAKDLKANFK